MLLPGYARDSYRAEQRGFVWRGRSDLTGQQQTTEQAVSTEDAAGVLLETVRQLAGELHVRSRGEMSATLDSSLERDLGFDSLGRVELLARIEGVFGISLPEHVLANAETPRDLLQAVLTFEPAA